MFYYYDKEFNKLKIGNKIFTELHPKLCVMLEYYLIHNVYVIENQFSLFVSRHFLNHCNIYKLYWSWWLW